MKEGFTPYCDSHKEGAAGLTPRGLNPYANNGESPMPDAKHDASPTGGNLSPSSQRAGQFESASGGEFTQLPFMGDAFRPVRADEGGEPPSDSGNQASSDTRSEYEQSRFEQGSTYKTFDEIYETAKAIASSRGQNLDDLSREERRTLFDIAKDTTPEGYEYKPEDRTFQPPPPISEVPFSKETEENLREAGILPVEEATRRNEAFLAAHPEYSPGMREVIRDASLRGVDMSQEIPQGGSNRRPTNETRAAQADAERRGRENTKIKDMNQLLEEIMDYSDPKWKRDGKLSLVKTEIIDGKEIETVNQENFMHWIQDRIVYYHGEDPDSAINMFTQVKLEREFKDITIVEMLNNQDKYFRDAHGNQYKDLADFVRLTLWQFSTYRTDDIEYKAGMGDDSGLNKIITKQFYNNSRSKPGFDNMSVFANVLTMANKYDSNPYTAEHRKDGTQPAKKPLDTDLGNALNTAFLAYFRISDPEKLREILGEQAKYLLDPEEIRSQIREAAASKGFADENGVVTDDAAKRFLESAEGTPINSANFLFTGKDPETPKEKAQMEKDIIQFINIFNLPTKNTDITNIVHSLMRKAIKEKFDLRKVDEDGKEIETGSATYAQLMASFMARPMGAGGRNDLAANANDAITKPMKLKPYRLKMAGGDRAGMVGNPFSVYMIKSVLVDYLNGARTETLVEDEKGKVIKDNLGKPHYYTLMEVMELMSAQGKNREGVMKFAKKLRPTDNSQRDWSTNHMNRGFEMFHDITESNEIDWSKFTEEDNWGNLRLNRPAFEKEFKDHFLKQMRYAYSTYGQLDFSKIVRDYDPDIENPDGTKGAWYDTPLVDTLFAKQVLNVEEFWKKDYKLDKNGKRIQIKGQKGKYEVERVHKGLIDPNEIQDNKRFLWKQLAIARIAADIRAHVDFFSTDPRYKPTYYLMMLEAIESIQDGLEGDEYDFRRTKKKKGRAFTHAQIQWLKEAAGITNKRIYLVQFGEDLAKGLGKGLKEAWEGTLKSAFKIA